MAGIISLERITEIWAKLEPDGFREPRRTPLSVGPATFQVLVPMQNTPWPDTCVETQLSLVAFPRYTAYRNHFVLVPKDNLRSPTRWQMRFADLVDLLCLSQHLGFIITVSTFKSGSSTPRCFHAQMVPARHGHENLSALADATTSTLIARGRLARFANLEIALLREYPISGVRLIGPTAAAAEQAFELAVSWDSLRAFNLVILPGHEEPQIFFFARRKDGRVTFGPNGWQVAAIECAGLLQAKTEDEKAGMNQALVKGMFRETSPSQGEFADFLALVGAPLADGR